MTRIIYDKVEKSVRMVKIEIYGYKAVITHDKAHGTVHVQFDQPGFLSPKIMYLDGEFILSYGHIVVFQEQQEEFLKSYQDMLDFCNNKRAMLDDIIQKIRKEETLYND